MSKLNLIIDTDPGIDDAIAIAIALFSEKVDVKLITTVAGNVALDKVTENARKLLYFFGKDHIPIAKGCESPIINQLKTAASVHGVSGMEGWDFENPKVPILEEHAVIAMKNLILNSKEKITIMAIGPLTNIAMLLKLYPEVKGNIEKIVFMGGSLTRGNHGIMSEFNINVDPEAAYVVVHSGVEVVMAGLDLGMKALILPEDSEKIKEQNKTGEMIYSLFKRYRGGSFNTGLKMYDSTAIAYLLNPELFESTRSYLDVELKGEYTRGCTLVDLKNYLKRDENATILTDINASEFRKWFIESLKNCN